MQVVEEQEDKFEVDSDWVMPQFTKLLPDGGRLDQEIRTLDNTYFDTAGAGLRLFGITLRPLQRPRPLRGGNGVSPPINPEHLRAMGIHLGASRARRIGRTCGRHRARARCAGPAGGDDPTLRH